MSTEVGLAKEDTAFIWSLNVRETVEGNKREAEDSGLNPFSAIIS